MKKTTTTKKRKSSRPSPDDDDDDDEKEKERNEAELPPARLSKEALIEKFKNFDDIKGPKVVGGGKRTTTTATQKTTTRRQDDGDRDAVAPSMDSSISHRPEGSVKPTKI